MSIIFRQISTIIVINVATELCVPLGLFVFPFSGSEKENIKFKISNSWRMIVVTAKNIVIDILEMQTRPSCSGIVFEANVKMEDHFGLRRLKTR